MKIINLAGITSFACDHETCNACLFSNTNEFDLMYAAQNVECNIQNVTCLDI